MDRIDILRESCLICMRDILLVTDLITTQKRTWDQASDMALKNGVHAQLRESVSYAITLTNSTKLLLKDYIRLECELQLPVTMKFVQVLKTLEENRFPAI